MSFARFKRSLAQFAAPLMLLMPALAIAVPARADVTVSGSVTDQTTHQPIPGALVVAVGVAARATTGESGAFTLTAGRPFSAIVVTRIGYSRRQVSITDVSQPVVVELAQAAVELQGLELSGRALAHSHLEDAQSTGTLTAQDLGRGSGLSLENSVNTLPGVLMQSRTPWGGAHLQIRGYYPNFSQNSNGFGYQTYLNDIPVTDASGFTVLDDIDFASLGSLDVIKGPVSSLYGGSIAGTVLMRTTVARPGETSLEQMTAGGSDGLFRTNTTFRTGSEASSILLNYGHQTYDSFRPNSGSQKDYARFTGVFHAGPKQALSAYFSYNNSYEQLAGEIDSTDFYKRRAIDNPVYAGNKSQIRIESNRIGFTDDYAISDRLSNKASFFATAHTYSQPFAHGFSDINRFNFGARNTTAYGAHVGKVKLDGVVGGQFQRTNYTSNGFTLPTNNPSDQENYAFNYYGFTEWTAGLPSHVLVTAGTTISANEYGIRNMLKNKIINDTTFVRRKAFPAEYTPHASVLKSFNDAVSVYGSVSRGYTAPALSSIIASDNSINFALKPEHATQYEIGSKGALAGRKLSYELALFDLEITDKLVSQRVGTVTFTTNVGKQRNRGAELTLSALVIDDPSRPVSLLRPWVTVTYSDFKYVDFKSDNNHNAATVDFSGKTVARVPKTVFNLGLDAATKAGFYAFGSFQYVDKAFVTFNNSNSVKAYSLLNAKVGYQHGIGRGFGLDAAAGGDNLLGSTFYSFIFVGPNYAGLAQAKDGGTGDGYIIPGPYDATFYGSARLTYSF